jgi:uncharacterized protein YukE
MNDFDKNMEKIFDVTPIEITEKKKETLPVPTPSVDSDLKQDLSDAYSQSKDNLQELLEKGTEAMDELLQICKAGQHPRAFEVYATLLKNMGDINDKLLDTQKKMREMDGKKTEVQKTNIDKAIFVGSTTELQKFLKNKE